MTFGKEYGPMRKIRKIDCHTHLINEEIRKSYFEKTDGYAIVLQFPEELFDNPDCIKTVRSDDRLFLCPAVSLSEDIPLRLKEIEQHLDDWKVVGLKIYLTYQSGKACDEKLIPIYEFAEKHSLTVTYHTGVSSLVLPTNNALHDSNAAYIAEVAEKYPTVNFVCAHMDDPRCSQCIDIVSKHKNIYTDFSGVYEPGAPEYEDMAGTICKYDELIHSRENVTSQILYGTDYCPPINLFMLQEYEYTIEGIFDAKDLPDVYFNNCMRAFPRIARFIKEP